MSASNVDPKIELQMKALVEQLSAYIETFHGGSAEYVSFDSQSAPGRVLPGLSALASYTARLGGGNGAPVLPGYRTGRAGVTLWRQDGFC